MERVVRPLCIPLVRRDRCSEFSLETSEFIIGRGIALAPGRAERIEDNNAFDAPVLAPRSVRFIGELAHASVEI